MRRKDWRIKKLKKNIYGRFKVNKIVFFLRKLILRRFRTLNRKNLIFNYIFYRFFFFYLKKKKISYSDNLYFKNNNNLNVYYPEFKYNKNIFNNLNSYKVLEKKLNLFYISNNSKKLTRNSFGNSICVFNNSNSIIPLFPEDDIKNLLCLKKIDFINFNFNFNFFFNFNLHNLNLIEIYKIIIYLYLLKK